MSELLPCPLCGEELILRSTHFGAGLPDLHTAYCHCGFAITNDLPQEEFIKMCNRRFQPENKPLTLDELRQMGGEPVWTLTIGCDNAYGCELIGEFSAGPDDREVVAMCNLMDGTYDVFADLYGKTWLAYRTKPEEVK